MSDFWTLRTVTALFARAFGGSKSSREEKSMGKEPIVARVTLASFLVSLTLTLVACASTPTISGDSSIAAVGAADSAAARSPDGPPQRGNAAGALAAARPDASKRAPVSPVPSPGTVFPSALPTSQAALDQMVAHFIDVGQGDAVLLEFSCGAVLIDTGGEATDEVVGRDRLGNYLRDFFLRRADLANTLKLVVLSHPHKDHTDGVTALLDAQPAITIENIVDNGATDKGSGISGQRKLQHYAADSGAGYAGLSEADITSAAGMTSPTIDPIDCRPGGGVDPKIVALWGRVDLNTAWANDANNDSVVVRVDFGNASFLFTGDLEKEGIDAMLTSYAVDLSAFDVDVLKVGHHGSHNATTEAFVAAITPKIAVIQAGDSRLSQAPFSAYSFAHPHQDAIGMLLNSQHGVSMTRPTKNVRVGVKGRNPTTGALPQFTTIAVTRAIYTTGWDGNIAVIANKDGTLKVETGF
jgi:competence protein ComEC